MARIRSIKPEFWVDEKVVECSAFARLLFIGLWNFCDDEGRMEFQPKKIKMQVFPADSVDISELFGELRRERLITVYVVDEKEYLQVNGFSKHQKVDKRTQSKLPSPKDSTESPRIPTTDQGRDQGRDQGNREDKSSQSAAAPPTCPHQEIIDAYHESLPELPRILPARWPGSKSETALRKRWRESEAHQTLDFWRQFFAVVRTNPHWMGENDRNWTADLHWLLIRGNFDKVMQRWENLA